MKISKETIIADVLRKCPAGKAVFAKYLPNCIKCGGSTVETIERGAKMHGVDPDLIVQELNRLTKNRGKSDG